MKNKTPKTIADLNINWTFYKGEGSIPIEESKVFSQFRETNPTICDLVIKRNCYSLTYQNEEFIIYSLPDESLASFITYLNYLVWDFCTTDFKLSHFERISDTKYIIHGK